MFISSVNKQSMLIKSAICLFLLHKNQEVVLY